MLSRSKNRTPSRPALSTILLSLVIDILLIKSLWPCKVFISAPVYLLQTLIFPSSPPVNISFYVLSKITL
jgi:hypothetical protein